MTGSPTCALPIWIGVVTPVLWGVLLVFFFLLMGIVMGMITAGLNDWEWDHKGCASPPPPPPASLGLSSNQWTRSEIDTRSSVTRVDAHTPGHVQQRRTHTCTHAPTHKRQRTRISVFTLRRVNIWFFINTTSHAQQFIPMSDPHIHVHAELTR